MTQLPTNVNPTALVRLSPDQRTASSSGWLAVSLNLGCQGIGYIYQRRWGAFWLGGLAAVASAVVVGAGSAVALGSIASPTQSSDPSERSAYLAGGFVFGAYVGIMAVGVGSAVEAGLAVNRSRRRLAATAVPPAGF